MLQSALLLLLITISEPTTASPRSTSSSTSSPPRYDGDATVKLDYATYRGATLPNGVSQWLGIRYAAPPVGDLRFRAPQDPPQEYGLQDAIEHGPICLPTPGSGTNYAAQSEDCLFLDVYAPTKGSNHPVYFFIQGGGFSTNSNSNYNGSGVIEAGHHNIVVVNFNYRVGPYGFLASQEILDDGSVNNGLKDQRKALEWVQKYIRYFGGDPDHVTMGGDSAGAQSVDVQVTAYGGRDDGLFHATAAESQSFPGIRSVAESQYNYDDLVIRSGCASEDNTLACLRNLTVEQLQEQNIVTTFPNAMYPPLYPYGPTLDNDFIQEYTYAAYINGNFVKVPAIGGDDSNEGTVFVPRNTSTVGQADTFIRDQWPLITPAQLKVWNSYFTPEAFPNMGNATYLEEQGEYYQALATGYGEMRYICPGINISQIQAQYNVPNWNYRWNVMDPTLVDEGYGVTHTVEVNALFGPENTNGGAPDSYYEGGVNAAIVPVIQAYWASFIRTYNPNTFRLPGTPRWEAWTGGNSYRRLLMQTNETRMEDVPAAQRERCLWFASIALSLTQ